MTIARNYLARPAKVAANSTIVKHHSRFSPSQRRLLARAASLVNREDPNTPTPRSSKIKAKGSIMTRPYLHSTYEQQMVNAKKEDTAVRQLFP